MEWFFKNNVAQANCRRSSGSKHETNNTLAPQRRSHYIVPVPVQIPIAG